MISLAMTTYNGSKFITQQLESILYQSRTVDEVIISDDCSTDNTVAIVEEFIIKNNLSNWTVMKNEDNQGYISNFNKAIERTNGDIIFLADQDDIWEMTKVELMVKKMRELNAKSLNTWFKIIDDKGKISKKIKCERCKENEAFPVDLKDILKNNVSQGCTMCFSKEVKDKYIKSQNTYLPHDWAINVLAVIGGGCWFWNRELILYRVHSNNTIGIKKSNISKALSSSGVESRLKTAKEGLHRIDYFINNGGQCRELDLYNIKSSFQSRIDYLENRRISSLICQRCLKKLNLYSKKDFLEDIYMLFRLDYMYDALSVVGMFLKNKGELLIKNG